MKMKVHAEFYEDSKTTIDKLTKDSDMTIISYENIVDPEWVKLDDGDYALYMNLDSDAFDDNSVYITCSDGYKIDWWRVNVWGNDFSYEYVYMGGEVTFNYSATGLHPFDIGVVLSNEAAKTIHDSWRKLTNRDENGMRIITASTLPTILWARANGDSNAELTGDCVMVIQNTHILGMIEYSDVLDSMHFTLRGHFDSSLGRCEYEHTYTLCKGELSITYNDKLQNAVSPEQFGWKFDQSAIEEIDRLYQHEQTRPKI